jgi:hypothetical protein
VLVGEWRRDPDEAVEHAIAAQQAFPDRDGELHWTVWGRIEKSLCDEGGSCGGVYPADK